MSRSERFITRRGIKGSVDGDDSACDSEAYSSTVDDSNGSSYEDCVAGWGGRKCDYDDSDRRSAALVDEGRVSSGSRSGGGRLTDRSLRISSPDCAAVDAAHAGIVIGFDRLRVATDSPAAVHPDRSYGAHDRVTVSSERTRFDFHDSRRPMDDNRSAGDFRRCDGDRDTDSDGCHRDERRDRDGFDSQSMRRRVEVVTVGFLTSGMASVAVRAVSIVVAATVV